MLRRPSFAPAALSLLVVVATAWAWAESYSPHALWLRDFDPTWEPPRASYDAFVLRRGALERVYFLYSSNDWEAISRAVDSRSIPAWPFLLAIVIVGSFLPIRWLIYVITRLEQRANDGLCPACGYDLRATPDKCPECGVVPKGAA